MNKLVDCVNIDVRESKIQNAGLGAFAIKNINNGELVEKGIVKLVDCDGNNNPYLFTWSNNRDKWAFASGCATFYNSSNDPNTRIDRDFKNNTFKIIAIKDIKIDDELTHLYKSINWRKCFINQFDNCKNI